MTLTANHNKAVGRGGSVSRRVSQSRHYVTPISHIRCQLSVITFSASNADPVVNYHINDHRL